jgi:alginate O-acetyltransferase complex protein AlgI
MAERSSLALFAWIWLMFLTLYFDFAGYSDMAIGTSRLFGLRVIENFDWPLFKRNISEFWRSWHLSLTNWCRDYIYFPVFGLTRNPILAILACMVAVGYWHGAHPKWLLWGAWHGAGLALWQVWQLRKRQWPALMRISRDSSVYSLASWALTVNFVVMGGLITAFDRPLDALRYFLHMLTPS